MVLLVVIAGGSGGGRHSRGRIRQSIGAGDTPRRRRGCSEQRRLQPPVVERGLLLPVTVSVAAPKGWREHGAGKRDRERTRRVSLSLSLTLSRCKIDAFKALSSFFVFRGGGKWTTQARLFLFHFFSLGSPRFQLSLPSLFLSRPSRAALPVPTSSTHRTAHALHPRRDREHGGRGHASSEDDDGDDGDERVLPLWLAPLPTPTAAATSGSEERRREGRPAAAARRPRRRRLRQRLQWPQRRR